MSVCRHARQEPSQTAHTAKAVPGLAQPAKDLQQIAQDALLLQSFTTIVAIRLARQEHIRRQRSAFSVTAHAVAARVQHPAMVVRQVSSCSTRLVTVCVLEATMVLVRTVFHAQPRVQHVQVLTRRVLVAQLVTCTKEIAYRPVLNRLLPSMESVRSVATASNASMSLRVRRVSLVSIPMLESVTMPVHRLLQLCKST